MGRLADLYGRKVVLVAGFVIMVPVPLVIIWAKTWGVVILMNVLLGVAQVSGPAAVLVCVWWCWRWPWWAGAVLACLLRRISFFIQTSQ